MAGRLLHMVIFTCLGAAAFGQLQPLIDQPHLSGLVINPAYAGSQEALNAGINSRTQWVGFEGSPSTHILSVHSPLKNKKLNLGVVVLGDRLGSRKETGLLVNYAYRIDFGWAKLSFGLAAGIAHLSTDLDLLQYRDQDDILALSPENRALLPEFSLGSYLYNDRYYLGISMPLFLGHPIRDRTGNYGVGFKASEATYILTGGYLFKLSGHFEALPSLLLKTNPATNTQLDIYTNVIYRERFWFGAGIRTSGSLSGIFQVQINPQLRIGYSYAYELSELSSYQQGTHEIVIRYNFRYLLNVVSPRYF